MGVGVQVPPRTQFVSCTDRQSALNSVEVGYLHLLRSIGHRIDVLNLSYGAMERCREFQLVEEPGHAFPLTAELQTVLA
jgi:hypothetical protein